MTDLTIRCACGRVQAVASAVAPATVNRVVCHCRGCAAYARALGRAEEILDARDGTDVFQMSPRRLAFTSGREQLACIRMTDKGALRFYAGCCKTPIAHTLASPRIPFMAINHACVTWDEIALSKDEVLGPVRARINGTFTPQEARRVGATRWALVKMLAHYVPMFLVWFVRRDGRYSPLFNARTGEPITEPVHAGASALAESKPVLRGPE